MSNSTAMIVSTKICRVCGYKAISFNFGVLTCGSCKSFFRRHALMQNDKHVSCRQKEKCTIQKCIRKKCQACRLGKCFAIGMKKELIMSRTKKETLIKNKTIVRSIIQIYKNSTDFKEHELQPLIELRHCVSAFCEENTLPVMEESKNLLHVANLEGYSVVRTVKFCKSFRAYRSLSLRDRLILLKNFYSEKGIVRGSFYTNLQNNGFLLVDDRFKNKAVFVKFSVFHEYKDANAYDVFRNFAKVLQSEMNNDSTIRDLILSLLLFKPRENLSCPETIRYQHVLYHYLLRRYLEQKHSNVQVAKGKYYSLIRVLNQMDRVSHFMKAIFEELKHSQQKEQIEKVLFEINNLQT